MMSSCGPVKLLEYLQVELATIYSGVPACKRSQHNFSISSEHVFWRCIGLGSQADAFLKVGGKVSGAEISCLRLSSSATRIITGLDDSKFASCPCM